MCARGPCHLQTVYLRLPPYSTVFGSEKPKFGGSSYPCRYDGSVSARKEDPCPGRFLPDPRRPGPVQVSEQGPTIIRSGLAIRTLAYAARRLFTSWISSQELDLRRTAFMIIIPVRPRRCILNIIYNYCNHRQPIEERAGRRISVQAMPMLGIPTHEDSIWRV